jgi:hypothetical protein
MASLVDGRGNPEAEPEHRGLTQSRTATRNWPPRSPHQGCRPQGQNEQ